MRAHLQRWWKGYGTPVIDWLNVDIGPRVLRFQARRVDILLLAIGVAITVYYWFKGGMLGALFGALIYIFVIMIVSWML